MGNLGGRYRLVELQGAAAQSGQRRQRSQAGVLVRDDIKVGTNPSRCTPLAELCVKPVPKQQLSQHNGSEFETRKQQSLRALWRASASLVPFPAVCGRRHRWQNVGAASQAHDSAIQQGTTTAVAHRHGRGPRCPKAPPRRIQQRQSQLGAFFAEAHHLPQRRTWTCPPPPAARAVTRSLPVSALQTDRRVRAPPAAGSGRTAPTPPQMPQPQPAARWASRRAGRRSQCPRRRSQGRTGRRVAAPKSRHSGRFARAP